MVRCNGVQIFKVNKLSKIWIIFIKPIKYQICSRHSKIDIVNFQSQQDNIPCETSAHEMPSLTFPEK